MVGLHIVVDRSADPWFRKDRSSRNWFAATLSDNGDDLNKGESFFDRRSGQRHKRLTDGAVNDFLELLGRGFCNDPFVLQNLKETPLSTD